MAMVWYCIGAHYIHATRSLSVSPFSLIKKKKETFCMEIQEQKEKDQQKKQTDPHTYRTSTSSQGLVWILVGWLVGKKLRKFDLLTEVKKRFFPSFSVEPYPPHTHLHYGQRDPSCGSGSEWVRSWVWSGGGQFMFHQHFAPNLWKRLCFRSRLKICQLRKWW